MISIYLAGQISPDLASLEWRDVAKEQLGEHPFWQNTKVVTPLHGKPHLKTDPVFHESRGMQATNINPQSIMLRDFSDVRSADVILVNMHLYDPERGLQGTLFELAWAWERRTPIVAFGGSPDQQRHPFLRAAVTEWHDTLDEAIESIKRYWIR